MTHRLLTADFRALHITNDRMRRPRRATGTPTATRRLS
jgi:hypothetical protein